MVKEKHCDSVRTNEVDQDLTFSFCEHSRAQQWDS